MVIMFLVRMLLVVFGIGSLGYCKVPTINLVNYEKSIYSQNGEDGVLAEIFRLLHVEKGYCVEFGACDGYYYSNTLHLRNQGWDCTLLGGAHTDETMHLYPDWVTQENIVDLFKKYQVPTELDLLSIDIDSNDWYIWHALGKIYRPKVVVIEYNQCFGMYEDKIIFYDPNRVWNGSTYFGASLLAYYRLGRKLGYSLVYADNRGLNAFFIRDDILEKNKLFFINVNNVKKIYRGGYTHIRKDLVDQPLKSSDDFL